MVIIRVRVKVVRVRVSPSPSAALTRTPKQGGDSHMYNKNVEPK
jgi:hypothetical protein